MPPRPAVLLILTHQRLKAILCDHPLHRLPSRCQSSQNKNRKQSRRDWKDSSVVLSTGCSSRGPLFSSVCVQCLQKLEEGIRYLGVGVIPVVSCHTVHMHIKQPNTCCSCRGLGFGSLSSSPTLFWSLQAHSHKCVHTHTHTHNNKSLQRNLPFILKTRKITTVRPLLGRVPGLLVQLCNTHNVKLFQ